MADPLGSQLFDATKEGRVSEVSSLLSDHPEINVNRANPDITQWTALHVASRYGLVEIVKLLLAHPDIRVNSKNKDGQTPLALRCWNGRVSVVRVMLKDRRINVGLDDGKGCTPLWSASHWGYCEVIEWLIASG